MKGKSKSKTVNKRNRWVNADKRKIIPLREQGTPRKDIEEIVGKMSYTTWRKIWQDREKIKNADCRLRDFNLSYKTTDSSLRKIFERRVFTLINQKSKQLQLDYEMIRCIMVDVQKEEDFRDKKAINELKVSNRFIYRYLVKHNLKYSGSLSAQKVYSQAELWSEVK